MSDKYDDVMTIAEAMEFLRLGQTKIYELIKSGELETTKVGGKRLTTKQACVDLLRRGER